MTPALQIGMVIGLIIALLGTMAGLKTLAARYLWSPEVQRKIVHVAAGSLAMCLPWVFGQDWPIYLLLGLTLCAMLAMRLPILSGLGSTLHSVERKSYGDFLLVVAVGLVLLFSDRDPLLYVLPLAVLTLADAAAALAGSAYGRHFFKVEEGHKSVEGSTVFFLVTLVVAMFALLLLSDVARPNIIVLAVAVAGFATLVEADSWQGFDNLFLPMGVLIFLATTVDASAYAAVLHLALLTLGIGGIALLTRMLGLSAHVARVYAVAGFMLLSVTHQQNVVLPIIALLGQLWLARQYKKESGRIALQAVSILALISFGFLALGETTRVSAINFYGLAMGGIALTGSGVIWAQFQIAVRFLLAAIAATIIFAVWRQLMHLNSPPTHWYADITIPAAGCFALCGAVSVWLSQRLPIKAQAEGAIIATVPALALYFWNVVQGGDL